jgi:transcriptional regulator with XRE-family HTH domain
MLNNRELEKRQLLERISKNVRKIRLARNLTQEEVAEQLDIHLVTYQMYESKKPFNMTVFNIWKIAKFYNVTVDSLLK